MSIDMPNNIWISAKYLQGDIDIDVFGVPKAQKDEEADILIGGSIGFWDFGIGYRYVNRTFFWLSGPEKGQGIEISGFGPAVYLGVGSAFGEVPFGWYAGLTWMPWDLEKEQEAHQEKYNNTDDLRNYAVEGGVYYSPVDNVSVNVGYRRREFYDADNYVTQGWTASVAVHF